MYDHQRLQRSSLSISDNVAHIGRVFHKESWCGAPAILLTVMSRKENAMGRLTAVIKRHWKATLVFLGVGGAGDILKEYGRSKLEDFVADHLGEFGHWLLNDPVSLFTLAVVSCLLLVPAKLTLENRASNQKSLICDRHEQSYDLPSRTRETWVAAVAIVCLVCAALVVFGMLRYHKAAMARSPIKAAPVWAAEKPAIPPPARKPHHVVPHHGSACTPKTGKWYPDYNSVPGGPRLDRPMVVANLGTSPLLMSQIGGDTYLFMKIVLTNRGEESIVKNWELCLVEDGKPLTYEAAEIPSTGVTIPGAAERITRENSLIDSAIKNPIAHAHTAGGWVTFKIPGTPPVGDLEDKGTLKGDLIFRDYLDHKYFFDMTGSIGTAPNLYVPGAPD